MNRISAVILTLNEEENIGRCLKSLKGLADEIILADSGSTDRTIAIAEEAGAKVLKLEWLGYGPTRNKAAETAQGDYLFYIDADEELSPELKSWLNDNRESLQGGYKVRRIPFYGNKKIRYGAWNPDVKLRLVPAGQAKWDDRNVHEQLVPSKDISIHQLPFHLNHFTYKSSRDHRRRAEKYAKLAAKQLKKRPAAILFLKMILSPPIKWFHSVFIKAGILDGFTGIQIAGNIAAEAFLKNRHALKQK